MSNKKTTSERVIDVLAEQFNLEPHQISLTTNLREEHGADSLDHVEIVMGLEEEFHMEITDEDAVKFEDGAVSSIVGYIESQVGK